jgi:hypothetical protein
MEAAFGEADPPTAQHDALRPLTGSMTSAGFMTHHVWRMRSAKVFRDAVRASFTASRTEV